MNNSKFFFFVVTICSLFLTGISPVYSQEKESEPFCITVPILLYHHIQPFWQSVVKKQSALSVDTGYFEQQMKYLITNGYTPISSKQLIDALRTHAILPPKSIIVTFDDGYADAYTQAFPILKKYGIHADMMVSSGLIGTSDYMVWDNIQEMSKSGLIYFTNHTVSHFPLNQGTSEKIQSELLGARDELEKQSGQKIEIVTYPYGAFNAEVISEVEKLGFTGALSTLPGNEQCDSFIYTLHRTHIGNASLADYGF